MIICFSILSLYTIYDTLSVLLSPPQTVKMFGDNQREFLLERPRKFCKRVRIIAKKTCSCIRNTHFKAFPCIEVILLSFVVFIKDIFHVMIDVMSPWIVMDYWNLLIFLLGSGCCVQLLLRFPFFFYSTFAKLMKVKF